MSGSCNNTAVEPRVKYFWVLGEAQTTWACASTQTEGLWSTPDTHAPSVIMTQTLDGGRTIAPPVGGVRSTFTGGDEANPAPDFGRTDNLGQLASALLVNAS